MIAARSRTQVSNEKPFCAGVPPQMSPLVSRVSRELALPTHCGGVSAFMKIARLAEAFNLPVTSHGAHDITVHLLAVALAGIAGFAGNELAAQVRLRAGRRLDSPALVADAYHARSDGFVSLGVVLSAGLVALGLPIADPIIAVAIVAIILRITWESWLTVRGRAHSH